jgi:hypothetical protein
MFVFMQMEYYRLYLAIMNRSSNFQTSKSIPSILSILEVGLDIAYLYFMQRIFQIDDKVDS